MAKALTSGGTAPRAPQDHGARYRHGFKDLDGHICERGGGYRVPSVAADTTTDTASTA